jgi:hypothetical protein
MVNGNSSRAYFKQHNLGVGVFGYGIQAFYARHISMYNMYLTRLFVDRDEMSEYLNHRLSRVAGRVIFYSHLAGNDSSSNCCNPSQIICWSEKE